MFRHSSTRIREGSVPGWPQRGDKTVALPRFLTVNPLVRAQIPRGQSTAQGHERGTDLSPLCGLDRHSTRPHGIVGKSNGRTEKPRDQVRCRAGAGRLPFPFRELQPLRGDPGQRGIGVFGHHLFKDGCSIPVIFQAILGQSNFEQRIS